MKPFLVGITRLSGSVKLRCALSLGSAVTGLDLRPGRPLPPSPEPSSGFEAALALASDSSAALAVRIFSSRFSTELTPGTVLIREWDRHSQRVMVMADGFAWNGQTYDSLSKVAFAITGTKWNGPRFFSLRD